MVKDEEETGGGGAWWEIQSLGSRGLPILVEIDFDLKSCHARLLDGFPLDGFDFWLLQVLEIVLDGS